jgi:uroporphyrinogen decarboxylase
MDSRERVQKALSHQNPDRVPTFFRRSAPPGSELSIDKMEYINGMIDVAGYVNLNEPAWVQNQGDGICYDELGIGRKFTGLYWDIVRYPLAGMESVQELNEYPWPDMDDSKRIEGMRKRVLESAAKGKAIPVMGSWGGSTGVFELSWYMRGLENFLVDLMTDIPFAEALLDIQLDLHKTRWKIILEEIGDLADIVCTGDDMATQATLLVSPEKYRSLIKPRQKAMIEYIKKFTKAKIYYHSCGAITPLIGDLLDIGVDILDPIQPSAMDTRALKDKYGRQITFFGGIDVQHVLPFGTPVDVRDEVLKRFDEMGKDGGLILGPSHWLQTDVPWENIHAMYEAIRECRY